MNPMKFLIGILSASVRKCGRCGGGLSGLGVVLLATLTSACTAAGMSRMQASQRNAVAICAAAQAFEASSDHMLRDNTRKWCAEAIRLATAETAAAAQLVEEGIQASQDAGIEVPEGMSRDAGAPAGVE